MEMSATSEVGAIQSRPRVARSGRILGQAICLCGRASALPDNTRPSAAAVQATCRGPFVTHILRPATGGGTHSPPIDRPQSRAASASLHTCRPGELSLSQLSVRAVPAAACESAVFSAGSRCGRAAAGRLCSWTSGGGGGGGGGDGGGGFLLAGCGNVGRRRLSGPAAESGRPASGAAFSARWRRGAAHQRRGRRGQLTGRFRSPGDGFDAR